MSEPTCRQTRSHFEEHKIYVPQYREKPENGKFNYSCSPESERIVAIEWLIWAGTLVGILVSECISSSCPWRERAIPEIPRAVNITKIARLLRYKHRSNGEELIPNSISRHRSSSLRYDQLPWKAHPECVRIEQLGNRSQNHGKTTLYVKHCIYIFLKASPRKRIVISWHL